MMRLSTYLRFDRLRRLVIALSDTNLCSGDAAVLLDCSNSAARMYLLTLMDEGIVESFFQPVRRGRYKTGYMLSKDTAAVQAYLKTLVECAKPVIHSNRHHVTSDPFLAALFGKS